jgi:hypothetical protein
LISKLDPLLYIYIYIYIYLFKKPYLSSRITRWQVSLAEYDVVYMIRKVIKGSAIVDHLANNTIEDYKPFEF